jgi:hypothetical protein
MAVGSTHSGKRWLAALILKLWNIAWDLWEHRNNIAHAANEAAIHERITNDIYTILATNEYSPSAAYLFTEGMREQLVSVNLSTKKSWLHSIHAQIFYRNSHQHSRTSPNVTNNEDILAPELRMKEKITIPRCITVQHTHFISYI